MARPSRASALLSPFILFIVSSFTACEVTEGPLEPTAGQLHIDVGPEEIRPAWTLFRPDGTEITGAGDSILVDLPAGDYELVWGPAEDWASPTPNPHELAFAKTSTETVVGNYGRIRGPKGNVAVQPSPKDLKAPWVLTGPDGFYSIGKGNEVLRGRAAGEYAVVWGEIDGFVTPDPSIATLEDNGTLHFDVAYVGREVPAGSIVVAIDPDGISPAWTVTGGGGTFTGQGDQSLQDLPAGEYTIEFSPWEGFVTPGARSGQLEAGGVLEFAATYAVEEPPVPGTIVIDLEPDEAGAGWSLTGPAGFVTGGTGDATLTDLETGDYTLTWEAVEGWTGPDPAQSTRSLAASEVLSFEGRYVKIITPTTPVIPSPGDWTDRGEIFAAGAEGEWDLYLWGGFAASAVKHEGTWLLYYQGSDGYDDVEETVTHRAIGVATSSDGIHFQKHAASPVITWLPTNGVEEGAASGGAFVSSSGSVHVYYGANTFTTAGLVSADARLASSLDGLTFVDEGIVLEHDQSAVWGSGDEIFPVIGFQAGDTWYSYYIPNNASASRGHLGVAWGADRNGLTSTAEVRASGASVPAWGPAGWARLSDSSYAIFVSNRADGHFGGEHVDVYTVDLASPASFDGPVQTYAFPNANKCTVMLDAETGTWFLYYRNADASAYGVRTAPLVLR